MNRIGMDIFPVMGEPLTRENTARMDFSPGNAALQFIDLADTRSFDAFVFGQIFNKGFSYGIGGYLEHRAIYSRSKVFATAEADFRNIHLGVDLWAAAGTPVFAPVSGKVFAIHDNTGFGNYGPTIILVHEHEGTTFYSLYGHLSRTDLGQLHVGQEITAGLEFCHIGPYPENGDWPPHLHFQLMLDMMGNTVDFPGVCSARELENYKRVCPDPNVILQCGLL